MKLSHGKGAQKKPWGLQDQHPPHYIKEYKTERAYMDWRTT